MAFASTILDEIPGSRGNQKTERWSFTALANDTSGVVTARYLDRVDDYEIDAFAGDVSSVAVSGRAATLTLPGSGGSPTTGRITLIQR